MALTDLMAAAGKTFQNVFQVGGGALKATGRLLSSGIGKLTIGGAIGALIAGVVKVAKGAGGEFKNFWDNMSAAAKAPAGTYVQQETSVAAPPVVGQESTVSAPPVTGEPSLSNSVYTGADAKPEPTGPAQPSGSTQGTPTPAPPTVKGGDEISY